jgi:hypothetical protein
MVKIQFAGEGYHLSVEIRVVVFGFCEDGIDGGQQHPAYGNDGFLG